MSTPQDRIQNDIKEALKARESERVSTLRMLLSAIKNEKIRAGREVDDKTLLILVQRAIKQRKESATQYREGGREELAAKEEREADVLKGYLPKQASEEEVRAAIEEFVAAEGLAGPKAMGQVMKAMLARFAGSTDGGTISRLAKDALAGS